MKNKPYEIPLPKDLYLLVKKDMRARRIRKFGRYLEVLFKEMARPKRSPKAQL